MHTLSCVTAVPDGNRRGSRLLGLNVLQGYNRGLDHFHTILQAAFDAGVQHFVLWGASESNLAKRDKDEVEHLFSLLKRELRRRIESKEEGIRFLLRGRWSHYKDDRELAELATEAERVTERFVSKCLTVLFGYNGLAEIAAAATSAVCAGIREFTPEILRAHSWNAHLPLVDLVIRTGAENGDCHFSDSLLPLHTEQAQWEFSRKLWPNFSALDLIEKFEKFSQYERRMGK